MLSGLLIRNKEFFDHKGQELLSLPRIERVKRKEKEVKRSVMYL